MKYLALSDLDNTLLTGTKEITNESIQYIKEWVKNGNLFCISTGRPYSGAYHFYEALGVDCPMVCDNGCSIYFIDGKNKFFSIEMNRFKEFLMRVEGMDDHIYITTPKNICYSHHLEKVPGWIIHNEVQNLEIVDGDIVENMKEEPLICNYWLKERCYDEFMNIIKEYDDILFYQNWGLYDGIYSFEIHSKFASKGLALRYLKEHYKIKENNTLAFGDELNDITMIEEAYYGVSMINGNQELKEKTKYHTEYDYNNNGVIEFLKKLENIAA